MSGEWVLGVDFGTSNTAAAHLDLATGSVATVPLTHQGNLMPSAVFVESPESILVGEVALNRSESNPGGFIPSPKRALVQGVLHANGYDLPPSAAVAAILSAVVTRATTAHAGRPPARLVLTHPEAWSPREIQVLLDAAATIGFDRTRVTTISEPRAAAHFYTRGNALTTGQTIAVFDFGGGTLDVAVLTAGPAGAFEVIAARGDNSLGGKNLDALIRRWIDTELADRNPELLDYLRRGAPVHVLRGLEDSTRRAKELLSEAPSATVTISTPVGQETLSLTRGELDNLIRPVLDQAVALARATFTDARLTGPGALSALYLTGGSSRIPLVHTQLATLGPIATLDDPKTVVAQGALIAAANAGAFAATARIPDRVPTPAPPQWPASFPATPATAANTRQQVPADGTRPDGGDTARSEIPVPRKWKRGPIVAGVAAVVLVGAVVGAIALSPDDTSNATEASGDDTGATSQTTTAGPPPVGADAVKAIIEALPQSLEMDSDCTDAGLSSKTPKVQKVSCEVDSKSFAVYELNLPGYVTFQASIDKDNANKAIGGWRAGNMGGDLVENKDGTAGAYIKPGKNYVEYVSTVTGLNLGMTVPGIVDKDVLVKILERADMLD